MLTTSQDFYSREASNGWIPKANVILFTGQHFTTSIWNDIGTMEDLASLGYRVVALELPGHGLSHVDPQQQIRVAEYIKLFIQVCEISVYNSLFFTSQIF